MNHTALIFTFTAVTLLVLASYAVEQLADTYTDECEKRQKELDKLDALVFPE